MAPVGLARSVLVATHAFSAKAPTRCGIAVGNPADGSSGTHGEGPLTHPPCSPTTFCVSHVPPTLSVSTPRHTFNSAHPHSLNTRVSLSHFCNPSVSHPTSVLAVGNPADGSSGKHGEGPLTHPPTTFCFLMYHHLCLYLLHATHSTRHTHTHLTRKYHSHTLPQYLTLRCHTHTSVTRLH